MGTHCEWVLRVQDVWRTSEGITWKDLLVVGKTKWHLG